MALDQMPRQAGEQRPVRRTSAPLPRETPTGLPSRSLLVALVLACVTLMVVDAAGGDDSPVDAARRNVGEVFGPVEAAVSGATAPLTGLPAILRTNDSLREEVVELEAANAQLRNELRTSAYDANRFDQIAGLCRMAGELGYALSPARVIALEPAQSFSSTVTIDAGADAGIHPDMTVLDAEGLVGRVTGVTSHTATVLLAVDAESTVGGRIGESMEFGFVHGGGVVSDDGRLDLELADKTVVPQQGQSVVTWGSEGGAPYVSGVPIGEVTKVYESLRDTSYRAVLDPYVDFTSLDHVGVVVPSGSDEAAIEADGSCG